MSVIHKGQFAFFGVVEPQPISNAPSGKVRIRMRNDDFVYVFIRDGLGIRKFAVTKADESKPNGEAGWKLFCEQGRNHRP